VVLDPRPYPDLTVLGPGLPGLPSCPSALKKVSPLELAFGLVRTWLKQHEEEAKDDPVKYIYKALDSVKWYEAFRYFGRAGILGNPGFFKYLDEFDASMAEFEERIGPELVKELVESLRDGSFDLGLGNLPGV